MRMGEAILAHGIKKKSAEMMLVSSLETSSVPMDKQSFTRSLFGIR